MGQNGKVIRINGDKKFEDNNMIDLGITEEDFHTKWYLTGMKNKLLNELANSVGDVQMYKIARELRQVVKELKEI